MTAPSDHADSPRVQRDALVELTRHVAHQESGGVLTAGVEILTRALGVQAGIGYRLEGRELSLVAEQGLPRKAKPWLARMQLDDEPWFVAQSAGREARLEQVSEQTGIRDGHSVQPILAAAGWQAVIAAPVVSGREVLGVLVFAADRPDAFTQAARQLVDAATGILALALVREHDLQRRREDRLREAKTAQLATIGLLASTVAANLAAPLGRLELQVDDQEQMLRELLDHWEQAPAQLSELLELTADVAAGLRTAQGITSRLLSFTEDSKLEPLDLSQLVDESAELMRESLAARGIVLDTVRSEQPLRVVGRRESLQLLLVQLVLHIATESASPDPAQGRVRIGVDAADTGHVVWVEGAGQGGVHRGTARLFDAFVRGRRDGEPATVGLALAKQTVLAHNGHIELAPSELGGTLVRVVFPTSETSVSRRRDFSSRPQAAPVGSDQPPPAVVWIDDDELYVRSLRRYLKAHAVHSARTIAGAEQLLRGLGEPPELIFCDVGLPDGDPIELHRRLAHPFASRFVFITGGVIPAEVAQYLVSSGLPTLIKPIALEEVHALLTDNHDEPASSPAAAPTLTERPRTSRETLRDGFSRKQ